MISIISIRNLKSLRGLDLDLYPLNVLSGINGVGKTTFIQALLLLRQSYEQGMLPSKGISLKGDYVHIGRTIDAYSEHAPREEGLSIELEFEDNEYGDFNFEFNIDRLDENFMIAHEKKCEYSDKLFKTNLFGKNFNYLISERLGPRILYELSSEQVMEKKQLGIRGNPNSLSQTSCYTAMRPKTSKPATPKQSFIVRTETIGSLTSCVTCK